MGGWRSFQSLRSLGGDWSHSLGTALSNDLRFLDTFLKQINDRLGKLETDEPISNTGTSSSSASTPQSRVLTAGAGLTGGGDLSADRTFNVGGDGTVGVTGAWTFSTNRTTFNAGISLGTNGTATSTVAFGASNVAFALTDTTSRAVATPIIHYQLNNSGDGKVLQTTNWDGRVAFGYGTTLTPTTGHVLSFLQDDTNSPASAPHYVGILSAVAHTDTAKTAALHYGIAGASIISTATGLTPTLVGGIHGSFISASLSTVSGVTAGCFVAGPFGRNSTLIEPAALNTTMSAANTGGGNYALFANYLGYCSSPSGTIGLPATANRPSIGCTYYAPIQKWPCGTAAGSAQGETWAIYGDSPDLGLTTTNVPAVTGFMRATYPRRTTGTTPAVHATHIWMEPWPITSTIKTGAVKGDVIFDDGTNFAAGLWQYTDSYNKLIDLHDFVSYEDDAVFYDDELVIP